MRFRRQILILLLFSIFTFLSFSNIAFATSAYLGSPGNAAKQKQSEDIVLEKDVLQIWLHKGYAEVEEVYQFYNKGGEQEFMMGFPELINSKAALQYGVYNFRAYIDGGDVDTRTLKSSDQKLGDYSGAINWHVNSVFIGEAQRRIVVHRYWIRLIPWESKFYIPLQPGSTWSGNIGDANYVLHLEGNLSTVNLIYPSSYGDYAGKYAIIPTDFKAGKDQVTWQYSNYSPKRDMQIQVFPNPYSMVSRVSATGAHIEDGRRYVAGYTLDQDSATAWGIGGPGDNEWITYDFSSKIWIREFRIIPGNGALEGMYKLYNRPHLVTLRFSDGSSQRFELKDKLEMQYFSVRPVQTRFVRVIINSVYKGIYPDVTYISEVEFGEFVNESKFLDPARWKVGLGQIETLNLNPKYSITDIITIAATILVFLFIAWQVAISIRLRNKRENAL